MLLILHALTSQTQQKHLAVSLPSQGKIKNVRIFIDFLLQNISKESLF